MAIHLMCAGKNGVSAHELHRSLDVTYKTAWFMCHRIREAMKRPPLVGKLTGVVEADETYIGGKPRAGQVKTRQEQGRWKERKESVVTLVERDGEARSFHMDRVTGDTVGKVLREQADPTATRLMTDSAQPYVKVGREFQSHETVNHHRNEYARGDVTSNRGRRLLRSTENQPRRHLPPRVQAAPTAVPERVRLPLLNPQADRLTAHRPSRVSERGKKDQIRQSTRAEVTCRSDVVPGGGFEPPKTEYRRSVPTAPRLPISPSGHAEGWRERDRESRPHQSLQLAKAVP